MFYDSSDIDLKVSIEDYYEANVFIYWLRQKISINLNTNLITVLKLFSMYLLDI